MSFDPKWLEVLGKSGRFLFQRLRPLRKRNWREIKVFLGYCPDAGDLYDEAWRSAANVLYVSIMSDSMVKNFKTTLDIIIENSTNLRVLTWHPASSESTIEQYRKHLDIHKEKPEKAVRQVQEAYERWKEWETKSGGFLEVRAYRSTPTLRALIVPKKWALVELIPYSTPKEQRPALLLKPGTDKELFELFESRFEQLWKDSGESCHPAGERKAN